MGQPHIRVLLEADNAWAFAEGLIHYRLTTAQCEEAKQALTALRFAYADYIEAGGEELTKAQDWWVREVAEVLEELLTSEHSHYVAP